MSGTNSNLLPIIVKKPLWRHVWSLFGSTIVMSIGIYGLLDRGPSWTAWTVVIVFSFSALYHMGNLQNSKPRLIISKDGINVDHWELAMLPWDDFSSAKTHIAGKDVFLCLNLRDPEGFHRKLNAVRRGLHTFTQHKGLGDLMVNLSDLLPDAAAAIAVAEQQIELAKTGPKKVVSVRYPRID